MKRLFAVVMSLLLVLSFAACNGDVAEDGEEATRAPEEVIAEAGEYTAKLVTMKTTLDADLAKINSAENAESFFDLDAMAAAVAAYEKNVAELGGNSEGIADAAVADEACALYHEIAEKINTCALTYYDAFVQSYGVKEIVKLDCIAVFMSGEPSCFFAVTYADETGAEKTLYAKSSFTSAVQVVTLLSMAENFFGETPIATRNAAESGNVSIDLDALYAAYAEKYDDAADASDGVSDAATDAAAEATDAAAEVTDAAAEVTDAAAEVTDAAAEVTDAAELPVEATGETAIN